MCTAPAGLSASRLQIKRVPVRAKTIPPDDSLVFGAVMTEHMFVADWHAKRGWEDPTIVPYAPFSLDPAALVLHYALECFEGMKAYRDKEGNIRLFRPLDNFARLNRSCSRIALPTFDSNELLKCLKELLKIDADWVPKSHGCSLYIRPNAIATTPLIGVQPTSDARLYIICSPVGPYYKTGFKAVSLLADDKNVRAWPGGVGQYKLGANYAPGIKVQQDAMKQGHSQVLWLVDDMLTEVGTMNLFVYWVNEDGDKELVTASLDDGTILPGVTRASVLDLSRSWNEFKVSERNISMTQLLKANDEGRLLEVFGAGTACVISPVKNIHYKGKDHKIALDPNNPESQAGPLAAKLNNTILAIQYGEIPSPWSVVVD